MSRRDQAEGACRQEGEGLDKGESQGDYIEFRVNIFFGNYSLNIFTIFMNIFTIFMNIFILVFHNSWHSLNTFLT